MADEKVSIIVDLVDNASEGLKNIKASMTDWDSAVASSQKFAAGLAVIGTAVAGIAAYSVSQAQEAVAGQKELAAVLESTKGAAGLTADQINSYAQELSRATNFTDDAVLSAENMLLTFTNIKGDVFPQATEATLNLAQKFGSVEAASVQLGKALNDPIAGVTALRKVGVALTDQQQEQIKKFVEMGDMASAQGVILKELDVEFGGLAKAVADPLTQAKNQFGEIAETLGMVLLPYVNQAATAFMAWMDSMGGAEGIVASLQATFAAIEPYFPVIAAAILGALVPSFYALAGSIAATMIPLLPWMAVGALIAGVILGIKYAIDNWGVALDWIVGKLTAAWNAIKSVTETVFDAIANYISTVWNTIKTTTVAIVEGLWTAITYPFYVGVGLILSILEFFGVDWQAAWESIKATGEAVWNALVVSFTFMLDVMKAIWDATWGAVKATADFIWGGIKAAGQALWDAIVGMFTLGSSLISSAWSTLWDGISGVVIGVWDGIKSTIASSINWIIDKINYIITKANSLSSKVGGPQLPTIPALTFAQGGIVPAVDWTHQGSDTVPALLTPGERVLTPSQNRDYEGGMGGTRIEIHLHDTNVFDSDDVVTKIGNPLIKELQKHFGL